MTAAWKHVSPCVNPTDSGNVLYDAGSPKLVLVTTSRGGVGGGREGTHVNPWLIHGDVQQE